MLSNSIKMKIMKSVPLENVMKIMVIPFMVNVLVKTDIVVLLFITFNFYQNKYHNEYCYEKLIFKILFIYKYLFEK